MRTSNHKIGATVWYMGDEYAVVSDPYTLYGGEFFDATRKGDGKKAIIATPKRVAANITRSKNEFAEQQKAFSRLSEKGL